MAKKLLVVNETPVDDDRQSTVESIRRLVWDVDAKESGIRVMSEQLKEIVESTPEWNDVADCMAELSIAKEKLRLVLMNRSDYNNLLEKIGSDRADLKDDREVLSAHVVEYYATTHERQIEMNDTNGDARPVIVSGKVGKGKTKFQTNLFSGAMATVSAEQAELVES